MSQASKNSIGLFRVKPPRTGYALSTPSQVKSDLFYNLQILQVTARYFPYMGGVETHVHEISRRFVRDGAQVTILTTDPTGTLPEHEETEGVQIHRVRAWPAKGDFYFAPEVYHTIMKGNWDVIHCQSPYTLVTPLALIAARRKGIPYVVTFHSAGHSSRLRHSVRELQWATLRPLLANANGLIGVSKFDAESFRKRLHLPKERFVIIPNGANLPRVNGGNSIAEERGLIVSIGRLERYKGHQRVITALPRVVEQYPEAHLHIVGSGPYEAELRRLADALHVADRVEIQSIPITDREGMAQLLARAALVTLLSEFEGNPVSVMEALSLGRPVLLADTSGLSEIAEQGLARAIPLKSTPEQVAAAILEQLEHPLVPTDVKLPSWDDCADNVLAVYHSIIRSQRCVS